MPAGSLSPLLPGELIVERTRIEADRLVIEARIRARVAACPRSQRPSNRVHNHYRRRPRDLPRQGRAAEVPLRLRRLRCDTPGCPRRIFAECVEPMALPRLRRTRRLAEVHRCLGLAVGVAPGARLARRLVVPVGADTRLHAVRAMALPAIVAPRVVPPEAGNCANGIDDGAWRRGRTYGTPVVDLERRRPIALLPDRHAETVAAWLAAHPSVEVVARDRAGTYADGVHRGAPDALRVADRRQLLRDLGDALVGVLERHHRDLAAVHAAVEREGADTPAASTPAPMPSTPQSRAGKRVNPTHAAR